MSDNISLPRTKQAMSMQKINKRLGTSNNISIKIYNHLEANKIHESVLEIHECKQEQ